MAVQVVGLVAYSALTLWCAVFIVQSLRARRWVWLALWCALALMAVSGIMLAAGL